MATQKKWLLLKHQDVSSVKSLSCVQGMPCICRYPWLYRPFKRKKNILRVYATYGRKMPCPQYAEESVLRKSSVRAHVYWLKKEKP